MIKLVYIGPFAAGVEIAETGQWADPGVTVEVDEAIAGRPPSGDPADEGYDPGAGLLAQTGSWAKPTTKAAKQAKERAPEPNVTDSEEQSNG